MPAGPVFGGRSADLSTLRGTLCYRLMIAHGMYTGHMVGLAAALAAVVLGIISMFQVVALAKPRFLYASLAIGCAVIVLICGGCMVGFDKVWLDAEWAILYPPGLVLGGISAAIWWIRHALERWGESEG